MRTKSESRSKKIFWQSIAVNTIMYIITDIDPKRLIEERKDARNSVLDSLDVARVKFCI